MKKLLVFFLLITFHFANAQKDVKIGTQIWMVENLNIGVFNNGEKIPKAQNIKDWKKAGENKSPIWCYYNFDDKNAQKYGRFYNWYVIDDPRGIAPKGWHIPSFEEWNALLKVFESKNVKVNETLQKCFKNYGGYLYDGDSSPWFYDRGKVSYFWSSDFNTEFESNIVLFDKESVPHILDRDYSSKSHGLYIKCIKDSDNKINNREKQNSKKNDDF